MKDARAAYKLFMRKDTILAAVLVHLLQGGRPLTAWDGAAEFGTLNLGATIGTLRNKYGWPIESVEVPMYKPDGLIFYVVGYQLPQVAIDQAHYEKKHLARWVEHVKVEQVRKREIDKANAAARESLRLSGGLADHFSNVAPCPYRR
jgi:hypothetical protein